MQKRELNTLRSQKTEELIEKANKLKIEVRNKSVEFYAGKLNNPKELTSLKRDISQILTIITEKKNKK